MVLTIIATVLISLAIASSALGFLLDKTAMYLRYRQNNNDYDYVDHQRYDSTATSTTTTQPTPFEKTEEGMKVSVKEYY